MTKTAGLTLAAALIVAASGTLASCGEDEGMSPENGPFSGTISVVDFKFEDSSVSVKVGTTVRWSWEGSSSHSVTSDAAGIFDSGVRSTGFTFSNPFDSAGVFPYHCTVHGASVMSGTITVTASGGGGEDDDDNGGDDDDPYGGGG